MAENREEVNKEETVAVPTGVLAEILETNRDILKSLNFIRNYFRWQLIWGALRWLILIAIIVFGFISLKTAIVFVQNYIKSYTGEYNSLTQPVNNLNAEDLKKMINANSR